MRTRNDRWTPQIAALLIGAGATLLLLTSQPSRALLRSAGISTGWAAKLREAPVQAGTLPRFYQLPDLKIGDAAWRRSGPAEVRRNVLADFVEYSGVEDHPYGGLPPVRVSYGPLGFRDELPAEAGGVALVGSSYLEAGFANVEDTIPGRLQDRHGRASSNFGMSFAGAEDILTHLDRFVLPTRPSWVVWVVSERFELAEIADPRAGDALGWARRGRARDFALGWANALSDSVRRRFGAGSPKPAAVGLYRYLCLYRGGEHDVLIHCPPPPSSAEVTARVDVLRPAVARARARTLEAGARLLVVLVPARVRSLDGVLEPAEPEARARWTPGTPLHRLDNGIDRFGEMVEAQGAHFLDLTPALSSAAKAGILTDNPILDRHLNADGMAVAAEAIAAALTEVERDPRTERGLR